MALWNPKVHCCQDISTPCYLILGNCFPNTLIIHLLQIPNDIILSPNFRPTTWALPHLVFLEEAYVHFFHLSSVQHALPIIFKRISKILVLIRNSIIMQTIVYILQLLLNQEIIEDSVCDNDSNKIKECRILFSMSLQCISYSTQVVWKSTPICRWQAPVTSPNTNCNIKMNIHCNNDIIYNVSLSFKAYFIRVFF